MNFTTIVDGSLSCSTFLDKQINYFLSPRLSKGAWDSQISILDPLQVLFRNLVLGGLLGSRLDLLLVLFRNLVLLLRMIGILLVLGGLFALGRLLVVVDLIA